MLTFLLVLAITSGANSTVGSPGALTGERSQNGEQPQPIPLLPLKEKVTPVETQKIDVAGKKLGQTIDLIGRKAAKLLGPWVNTTLFLGITWLKLLVCFLLIFLVIVLERFIRFLINRRIRRLRDAGRDTSWHFLALQTVQAPLSLFIWVYGVYGAISPLFSHFQRPDGSNPVHFTASRIADIGGLVTVLWILYRLIKFVDLRLYNWAKSTGNSINLMIAPLVGRALRVFMIIIGSIMLLQALTGVDLAPLIASLGIGGLALALAAKGSVENFFGTLTILLDQPFQVGDRIIVEGFDGVVEEVGFRSIRLRTLTGHLVTVPNDRIVTSSIENISKRPHIRWLTNITITYDTPPEKVRRAVEILEDILRDHEGMHPDFPPRVFFNGFNDWSLNIMVIAWYHPPDYWAYQAWLQKTCMKILEEFEKEGIEFAFPTRTVYLAHDERRRLALSVIMGDNPVTKEDQIGGDKNETS